MLIEARHRLRQSLRHQVRVALGGAIIDVAEKLLDHIERNAAIH